MLRTVPAADYVGVSPQYLEKLRVTGGGPEFVKLGRAVRYEKDALDRWIASNRRRSTSDLGRAA
jgi:excisionase family DNA binding protein